MDSFVADVVASSTAEMQSLVVEVINTYWGTIFSIIFVGMIISLAWWAARKVFGHKQF